MTSTNPSTANRVSGSLATTCVNRGQPGPLQPGPDGLREKVTELNMDLQLLAYSTTEGRLGRCKELQGKIGSLLESPSLSPDSHVAHQAAALAAYLRTLCEHPEEISESNLRTVSSGAEVLDSLVRVGTEQPQPAVFSAVLLDLDEDSRAAVAHGLQTTGFDVYAFDRPAEVLSYLEENPADLVVIDVPVPVPAGFDVSQKIAKLPLHQATPTLVILCRTNSGENLSVTELVLKGLTLVHKKWLSEAPAVIAALNSAAAYVPSEVLSADASDAANEQQPVSAPEPQGDELERLRVRLQQELAERKQLEQQLKHALAAHAEDAAQRALERQGIEADLQAQVGAVEAATEQAQTQLQEKVGQLEQKLLALQNSADQANERAQAYQALLAQAVADLQASRQAPQNQTSGDPGAEPTKAIASTAPPAQATGAENDERCRKLQEELAARQSACEEAEQKLTAQTQAAEEARNRALEAETHSSQLSALNSQLSTNISAAKQRLEAAEKQLREKDAELQAALAREAFEKEFKTLSEAEAAEQRSKESEANAKQAAELEQVRAQLKEQSEQHQRLQSEHQALGQAKEALEQELRRLSDSYSARAGDAADQDHRVREALAALARVTAELQEERGHRQRAEDRAASTLGQLQRLHDELPRHLESERAHLAKISELEKALQDRDELASRLHADLEKETADRQLAEEKLRAFGDMTSRLEASQALFDDAIKNSKQNQVDLESRLQASLRSAEQTQEKLQQESHERQRLQDALAAMECRLQEEGEKQRQEAARLQGALQLETAERKRLNDLLRAQHDSMKSAFAGSATFNTLRHQMRQPVESVRQSACSLLQTELPDDQKKVVHNVLENALFLQNALESRDGSNGKLAS